MSARLGPGNLLYDHGLPLRKLAMDRAAPAGDGVPWSSLSPAQQRLLKGITEQWPTLTAGNQQKLASDSQALLNMSPEQRQRWLDMSREQQRDVPFDAVAPAARTPTAVEITVDAGDALRDSERDSEREQLAKLIPNLYRL